MVIKTQRQKLNRIEAVFVETGQTGKWLAEQLGKDPVTVSKWCANTSLSDLYAISGMPRLYGSDYRKLIRSTLY